MQVRMVCVCCSENQEAIPADKRFIDQLQHGLGLAAADAAHNQEVPCLPFAPQRDGRHECNSLRGPGTRQLQPERTPSNLGGLLADVPRKGRSARLIQA
jgi:hypothetical protein